ncbi:MAG: DUF2897 family protein [Gammaproteobacteria bacterium]
MMRMVLEIVMVMAVVIGMLMLMKVTAKETNDDKTLRDREESDDDAEDEEGR